MYIEKMKGSTLARVTFEPLMRESHAQLPRRQKLILWARFLLCPFSGWLCIIAVGISICATDSVRCKEVVRFSEGLMGGSTV